MIVGFSAGGGSGGILTVTGTTGDTVTASKDGKTYVKTFDTNGIAVFKGLTSGVWTVTMENSIGQTSIKTIEITADYLSTISYFSATIAVTYPANSTCVVKDSSGATIASDTNTDTNAKTWTVTVNAAGDYTVTATANDGSGATASATLSITTDGQSESISLSWDMYVFKAGLGATVPLATKSQQNSSITITNDVITFSTSGTGYEYSTFYTESQFDLTDYKQIVVKYSPGTSNRLRIGVGKAVPTNGDSYNNYTWTSYLDGIRTSTMLILDVSSLSGSYYIVGSGSKSASVTEIQLIRSAHYLIKDGVAAVKLKYGGNAQAVAANTSVPTSNSVWTTNAFAFEAGKYDKVTLVFSLTKKTSYLPCLSITNHGKGYWGSQTKSADSAPQGAIAYTVLAESELNTQYTLTLDVSSLSGSYDINYGGYQTAVVDLYVS